MENPLDHVDHRPWELPERSWLMAQQWRDLLFAHWAVPPEKLEPLVPAGLTLESYGGQAWIGVVPFRMQGIHPRFIPSLPWISAFAELNVRTYVTDGHKPGVLFMSLDAANPLAVAAARRFYHLPYFNAKMSVQRDGDTVTYRSVRTHKNAPEGVFEGTYYPVSDEVYHAEPGSLDQFLVERYCLYTTDKNNQLYRGEIHHPPWGLQKAEAEIKTNTVAPFKLPDTEALLHFTEGVDVVVWAIEKVD
ncbi:MAG: DUF2071 domain-containing protein [Chloroflexi bacterium]|nr:DUF2071 domain-containing protein [Chloroflexota bacterium]